MREFVVHLRTKVQASHSSSQQGLYSLSVRVRVLFVIRQSKPEFLGMANAKGEKTFLRSSLKVQAPFFPAVSQRGNGGNSGSSSSVGHSVASGEYKKSGQERQSKSAITNGSRSIIQRFIKEDQTTTLERSIRTTSLQWHSVLDRQKANQSIFSHDDREEEDHDASHLFRKSFLQTLSFVECRTEAKFWIMTLFLCLALCFRKPQCLLSQFSGSIFQGAPSCNPAIGAWSRSMSLIGFRLLCLPIVFHHVQPHSFHSQGWIGAVIFSFSSFFSS